MRAEGAAVIEVLTKAPTGWGQPTKVRNLGLVGSRFEWGGSASEETHLDPNRRWQGIPMPVGWDKARLLSGGWRTRVLVREVIMPDPDIQKLENQLPSASGSAFAAARERVLASGQSVLQSQDGVIYEVFPDGRKVPVKRIEPPSHFAPGSIFTLR